MKVYREAYDAIEGERVACQFRKMKKITLVSGTSRHRAQRTVLHDAFCVIVKALELA